MNQIREKINGSTRAISSTKFPTAFYFLIGDNRVQFDSVNLINLYRADFPDKK